MYENSPYWTVNLFLILFLSFFSAFLLFIKQKKINFLPIKKPFFEEDLSLKIEKPNIEAILETDIFNAQPKISEEEDKIETYKLFNIINIKPAPNIPSEVPVKKEKEEERAFLPPLQISLNGTIINSNPRFNRAFIENTRNKEEKSYLLGDVIDDSQIIFIGKDKVIFIRSNGQQETLFINKVSENQDEIASKIPWNKIIKQDPESDKIKINCNLLKKRIDSVGNFLDELDIITSFKNGIPIGSQIGNDSESSLANSLNLQKDDIILSINDILTSSSDSRKKIYKDIMTNDYKKPKNLKVKILRNEAEITLNYEIFCNEEEELMKNINILSLANATIEPQRSNLEKKKIEKEFYKGHDSLDNLSKEFENEEKKFVNSAGKGYAIKR